MIHVLEQDPAKPEGETRIRCGLVAMPAGDTMFFEGDSGAWLRADCEGCNPGGPKRLGTPISQLSGRPGHAGFEAFRDIAASWGYE
jgi:hypothetical protein